MARGTGVNHAAQPTVGALAERRRTIQRLAAAVQDHVTAAVDDLERLTQQLTAGLAEPEV